MLTERTIEEVMVVLRRKYKEKGSDFVFKSKHIAKELDLPPQTVGRILADAVKYGYPVDYYTKAKTGRHIWQTTFKDKSKLGG